MRHLLTAILFLVVSSASSQTMFMQPVKLASGDSATVNVSEVRVMYENTNGTGRFIYGYPNSTVDTKSDYDDILAASCGNLVSIVAVQPGGTKRMAFNPQWVYRVFMSGGKTKIQMRETNQIFESPWSYYTVSTLLGDCAAASTVGIDSITFVGDSICIHLNTGDVNCFVLDTLTANNIYTSNGTVTNNLRTAQFPRSLWFRHLGVDTIGFFRADYGLLKKARLELSKDSAVIFHENTVQRGYFSARQDSVTQAWANDTIFHRLVVKSNGIWAVADTGGIIYFKADSIVIQPSTIKPVSGGDIMAVTGGDTGDRTVNRIEGAFNADALSWSAGGAGDKWDVVSPNRTSIVVTDAGLLVPGLSVQEIIIDSTGGGTVQLNYTPSVPSVSYTTYRNIYNIGGAATTVSTDQSWQFRDATGDIGASFTLAAGEYCRLTWWYSATPSSARFFVTKFKSSGASAADDVSVYTDNGLLKAGGTTVTLDSGSLKLNLKTTASATVYGIEMVADDATSVNRFISMKTDAPDSLRFQEANGDYSLTSSVDFQFNIFDQERHVADSVQWIEGTVQDIDSTRFLLAATSTGWMKRYDAGDIADSMVLVAKGTTWQPMNIQDIIDSSTPIPEAEVAFGNAASDGITSSQDMTFFVGDALYLIDAGVDVTDAPVVVSGTANAFVEVTDRAASGAAAGGILYLRSIDGAAISSGDRTGVVQFIGQTAIGGSAASATIESFAAGAWGVGDAPGKLTFSTTPDGTTTPANVFELAMTGAARLHNYGDGTFTGTATKTLQVDVDGNIIEGSVLAGGIALGAANQIFGMNAAGTANEYKTLSGTANQVTVTHGVSTVTLATPQNIHTAATPTFSDLTLSDDLFVTDDATISGSTTNRLTVSGSSASQFIMGLNAAISIGDVSAGATYTALGSDGLVHLFTGSGTFLRLHSTNASGTGASNASFSDVYKNDGAALANGHYLGSYRFGSRGASNSEISGAQIAALADGGDWTDASAPTKLEMSVVPTGSTALDVAHTIRQTGQHEFNNYGGGAFTGTPTYALQVTATGQVIEGTVSGGVTDHGALTGLGDDDHTQYLLLLGRSGGQVGIGGTGSGDDLTLRSTSHATKGDVIIADQGGGVATGENAAVTMRGQVSSASGRFSADGDAQHFDVAVRRQITGESATELFIDGAGERMSIAASRVWTGTVRCTGTVQAVGNGATIVAGDTYAQITPFTVKRVGGTTTLLTDLIGTANAGWSDTNMTGSAFTITGDDTNDALQITFTPPTLGGTTTVCNAVCTVEATQLGF